MTFILQHGYANGSGVWDSRRYFIDLILHKEAKEVSQFEAENWVEAKNTAKRLIAEIPVA